MTATDDALSLSGWFPEMSALAAALRAQHLTVAAAESCTGGLLGAALTSLPGASAYMRGGIIAYADAAKADLLGVSRHELAEHGAVSEPVARAMAGGVRERCHASIGIAITGVAGPDGGSPDKPVGLIYVSVVTADGTSLVRRLEGDEGRDGNRVRAVRAALHLCLEAAAAPPPTG